MPNTSLDRLGLFTDLYELTMMQAYLAEGMTDTAVFTFRGFAKTFPGTTLLVDTYDTLEGVRRVIELMKRARDEIRISAIRLDSGDLGTLPEKLAACLLPASFSTSGSSPAAAWTNGRLRSSSTRARRSTASAWAQA